MFHQVFPTCIQTCDMTIINSHRQISINTVSCFEELLWGDPSLTAMLTVKTQPQETAPSCELRLIRSLSDPQHSSPRSICSTRRLNCSTDAAEFKPKSLFYGTGPDTSLNPQQSNKISESSSYSTPALPTFQSWYLMM